ncbi:MAG: carboxypeptidase-like regulatory domain-containing protein [Paludibacteraceae bacterium]|nr:carboxypeptidase-like regulatory domain-containing protein [Paludibacteraceae bacterium]
MRWNNIPSDITIVPMYKGKSTCETLKSIRKQIAYANDIPYEPRVCTHKGDCMGTCPACESEMRYIENQLNIRKMAGKTVKIVGLATVMTMASSVAASNETEIPNDFKQNEVVTSNIPSSESDSVKYIKVKGVVKNDSDTLLPSVNVMIKGTSICTNTDLYGNYEIVVPENAVLEFSSLGYMDKSIIITEKTPTLLIVTLLKEFNETYLLDEGFLMGGIDVAKRKSYRMYSRKPVKKCTKEKRRVRH